MLTIPGRTGRIGNRGTAFSFYTERDEPLAELLAFTLLEMKQDVPDFLQQYVPEGYDADTKKLKFEPDSDECEEEPAGGSGDAWGASDDAPAGDSWGGGGEPSAAGANNGTWGASDDASGGNTFGGGGDSFGGGAAVASW